MRCKHNEICKELKGLKEKIEKQQKELEEKGKLIEKLESENIVLKYDIAEMRNKWFKNRKVKKDDKSNNKDDESKRKKENKKRGAPVGHKGWFRKKPKQIDEIIEIEPEKCSHCGSVNVKKCKSKTEEHIQEDIVIPKVKATKHIHHYGYCEDCHKIFCPKGDDELLNSYIGPTAKALAVYLKYEIKVSDRDIQELFEKLFGLKIDPSSIVGFRNQLRRAGITLYEELLKDLKKSPVVNADETGWNLNGKNYWLWNFSTSKISFTHIDPSRGQKVVSNIMGNQYNGILVSDFLSAYDKIKTKAKQKCIPHLKRAIKKVKECYKDDKIVQNYCINLKELLDNAMKLKKDFLKKLITVKWFNRKRTSLTNRLNDFFFPNPQKGILLTLSKRLIKHKDNLFTFLYHKDVPYHNNHAEQQIRNHVLMRKITFCNRSTEGIINHNVLSSLIQTAKLNDKDPLVLLKNVLLADNKEKCNLIAFVRGP